MPNYPKDPSAVSRRMGHHGTDDELKVVGYLMHDDPGPGGTMLFSDGAKAHFVASTDGNGMWVDTMVYELPDGTVKRYSEDHDPTPYLDLIWAQLEPSAHAYSTDLEVPKRSMTPEEETHRDQLLYGSETEAQLYGTHWKYGDGPGEYGWAFENGMRLSGEEAINVKTWDQVLDYIPQELAAEMQELGHEPHEFAQFLMDHPEYFTQEEAYDEQPADTVDEFEMAENVEAPDSNNQDEPVAKTPEV